MIIRDLMKILTKKERIITVVRKDSGKGENKELPKVFCESFLRCRFSIEKRAVEMEFQRKRDMLAKEFLRESV